MALLTAPKAWRGLDPIDAWIMLGMYVLYLAQALLRGRQEREDAGWSRREILEAVAGVFVLTLVVLLLGLGSRRSLLAESIHPIGTS